METVITDSVLKKLAGHGAFERGVEYFNDGRVKGIDQQKDTYFATILGTEEYEVQLSVGSRGVDGFCSCPASEGVDFCKHCVAVALVIRSEQLQIEQQGNNADKKQRQLLSYLQTLDRPTLVDQLNGFITADKSTYKRWLLKADLHAGNISDRQLKKHVTAALPYRDLWEYRAVMGYFRKAYELLSELFAALEEKPAETRIYLVEYAYERLNRLLLRVDDSGGARFALEHLMEDVYTAAVQELDWSAEKNRRFLIQALENDYDVYPDLPLLLDGLNSTELTSWLPEELERQWQDARSGNKPLGHNLYSLLLIQASSCNDTSRQIELMAYMADSLHDYERLCVFCLEQGLADEAERWLQYMENQKFRHSNPKYIKSMAEQLRIEICRSKGELQAAISLQWQAFLRTGAVREYSNLLPLLDEAGIPEKAYFEQAESVLQERMSAEEVSDRRVFYFSSPANLNLLQLYISREKWDKAIALAEEKPTESHQLIELARKIAGSRPEAALSFYQREILNKAEGTGNHLYDDIKVLF
ncbi:MAG: SWIM zinc finger family protein [Amphritea sp.]|nr:SWIM zinc finger family protein [Amphritea sp.]